MDAVYEELDEVKSEIEKLREQYRVKTELAESLRKAHEDQLSKNKAISSKLDKLSHEINEKDDELFSAKQMNEDLKSNLKEKESIIKQITSMHEKLRVECNEKLRECDEENKALAFALDDANAKSMDQEQQIRALEEEIEGVKRLVAVSQKKLLESDNSTKVSKEVEQSEDVFIKLEEDTRKFEDQLKWKKEQFGHLEESHKKLRSEFKVREKEWEKEKSVLIDDLSSLQAKLESQIRISQDLQRCLEMCEQALAHSESKRKILEAELSESRSSFDSVCGEYDLAKLNFETLTSQRDQEFANLRSSLSTKEILYKEMEYQFRRVELEKQELLLSLKELQEDQIREARVSSSASKLQNKLKSLEREHRGCSANLKEKELEWRSQMEKLTQELNMCKSELKSQDITISKLETELEACDSLMLKLEILNQETSLMLFVLRSEFSEAQLRLADANSYMDLKNQENVRDLIEQLETKKVALSDMRCDLEEEREKVLVLSEKVRTLEELQIPLQKELDRLREMLKESSTSREQVLQLQSDLEKVNEALERANEELCEKLSEADEIEFELYLWKSVAEQLEATMELNHQMRREVEASLLAQVEVEANLKQEKESLSHMLEEKERRIEDLEQQLVEVSQSVMKVDEHISGTPKSDSSEARNSTCEEQEEMDRRVEEKDHRIGDLQQLVTSLENEFESSTSSFYSRLSRMQKEMSSLSKSWEKMKEMEILKEIEIQEKNLMIEELENELEDLREIVEQQDKALFGSELKLQETKGGFDRKKLEARRLKCENKKLLGNMNLLSEKIKHLAAEDAQLMENLGKIVHNFGIVWNSDDVVEQENMQVLSSPSVKKGESLCEERSPFRAINT